MGHWAVLSPRGEVYPPATYVAKCESFSPRGGARCPVGENVTQGVSLLPREAQCGVCCPVGKYVSKRGSMLPSGRICCPVGDIVVGGCGGELWDIAQWGRLVGGCGGRLWWEVVVENCGILITARTVPSSIMNHQWRGASTGKCSEFLP